MDSLYEKLKALHDSLANELAKPGLNKKTLTFLASTQMQVMDAMADLREAEIKGMQKPPGGLIERVMGILAAIAKFFM